MPTSVLAHLKLRELEVANVVSCQRFLPISSSSSALSFNRVPVGLDGIISEKSKAFDLEDIAEEYKN